MLQQILFMRMITTTKKKHQCQIWVNLFNIKLFNAKEKYVASMDKQTYLLS